MQPLPFSSRRKRTPVGRGTGEEEWEPYCRAAHAKSAGPRPGNMPHHRQGEPRAAVGVSDLRGIMGRIKYHACVCPKPSGLRQTNRTRRPFPESAAARPRAASAMPPPRPPSRDRPSPAVRRQSRNRPKVRLILRRLERQPLDFPRNSRLFQILSPATFEEGCVRMPGATLFRVLGDPRAGRCWVHSRG
jgi:hypothetical protein